MAGMRISINRATATLILAVGLLTFFFPIVTTDSVVHGRAEWAPLDLLVSRVDLWRPSPPQPFPIHAVLYEVVLIYVLMVLALVVLALPSPEKPLPVIALIGSAASLGLFHSAPRAFGWMFYGRFTHSRLWTEDFSVRGMLGWEGLHFTFAYFLLLSVMPLLFIVVSARERRRPDLLDAAKGEPGDESAFAQR